MATKSKDTKSVWGKKLEYEPYEPDLAGIARNYLRYEFEVKKEIYGAARKTKPKDRVNLCTISFDLGLKPDGDEDDMERFAILQIKEKCLQDLEDRDVINGFEIKTVERNMLPSEVDGFQYPVEIAEVRFSPDRVLAFKRVRTLKKSARLKFAKSICSYEYSPGKWVSVARQWKGNSPQTRKGIETRQYKLLRFLFSSLGTPRTVDATFDAIRLPKDRYIREYNDDLETARKIETIINTTIKEIYRHLKHELRKKKVKAHNLQIRFVDKKVWIQKSNKQRNGLIL